MNREIENYINDFKNEIKEVLEGTKESTETYDHMSIHNCYTLISALDYEVTDKVWKSNGWEWDFCNTVTINSKKYKMAGSGYFGYIQFYKKREDRS